LVRCRRRGWLLNYDRRLLLWCWLLLRGKIIVSVKIVLVVHQEQNHYRYERNCYHHDYANGRSRNAPAIVADRFGVGHLTP
jgi:hypothetical protein